MKAAHERFAAVISVWPVCGPEPRCPGCHGPSVQSLTCRCGPFTRANTSTCRGARSHARRLRGRRSRRLWSHRLSWASCEGTPRTGGCAAESQLLGASRGSGSRAGRGSVPASAAPPAPPPAPQSALSALPGVLRPPEVPVLLEQRAAGPGGRDRVPRSAPSSLSPGCSGREHNLCSWRVLLTWPGAQGWGLPHSSRHGKSLCRGDQTCAVVNITTAATARRLDGRSHRGVHQGPSCTHWRVRVWVSSMKIPPHTPGDGALRAQGRGLCERLLWRPCGRPASLAWPGRQRSGGHPPRGEKGEAVAVPQGRGLGSL